MKLHLELIRKLPAHLRSGMAVPASIALALMGFRDAGKNPAAARIEAGQDQNDNAALVGSGKM